MENVRRETLKFVQNEIIGKLKENEKLSGVTKKENRKFYKAMVCAYMC